MRRDSKIHVVFFLVGAALAYLGYFSTGAEGATTNSEQDQVWMQRIGQINKNPNFPVIRVFDLRDQTDYFLIYDVRRTKRLTFSNRIVAVKGNNGSEEQPFNIMVDEGFIQKGEPNKNHILFKGGLDDLFGELRRFIKPLTPI